MGNVKLLREKIDRGDRDIFYLLHFTPPLSLAGAGFSNEIRLNEESEDDPSKPIAYAWVWRTKDSIHLTPARGPNDPVDRNRTFVASIYGVASLNEFLNELGRSSVRARSWEDVFGQHMRDYTEPVETIHGDLVLTHEQFRRRKEMELAKVVGAGVVGALVGFAIGKGSSGSSEG